MPDLGDVRRIASSLPEVDERPAWGTATWRIGGGRSFVWERPFSKADVRRDGEPPAGELLGVRVVDGDEKDALLAAEPAWFFTISHFDGYPAVLLRLADVPPDRLREIIIEAWYAIAPPAVATAYPDLR